jgi:ABC-type protease/lipase transport system fused ATPase/permease subunit
VLHGEANNDLVAYLKLVVYTFHKYFVSIINTLCNRVILIFSIFDEAAIKEDLSKISAISAKKNKKTRTCDGCWSFIFHMYVCIAVARDRRVVSL